MAKQGSRKRVEENAKRLRLLQYIMAISTTSYAVVKLYLYGSTATWWTWTGFIICLVVFFLTYGGIANFAKPVYDEAGQLIDGGADLNMGGMCSYYHDLLYLTGAVLVLTCISSWFWLLYLIPPGFALYKLWVHILQPWFSAEKEPVIDEATRKKMERAQQRAERRRNKW